MIVHSVKQRDVFRLLYHGLKNVMVITYDELPIRLENHINVLKKYQADKHEQLT